MELPGQDYLFNLSLVAISFAAVSALVMLIRQFMGGGLSKYDIHLIASYISYAFVLSLLGLLPPLVSLFPLAPRMLWTISSGLAVLIFAPVLASVIYRRKRASPHPVPLVVKASFCLHGLSNILLLANAAIAPWQGIQLYAAALTLSLATVMWTFARRIASLFGDKPAEGFDPDRG
jgi:hypothetical protein